MNHRGLKTLTSFTAVSALCAFTYNVFMIAADAVGVSYRISLLIAFCINLVLGFILLRRFTFQRDANGRSFLAYAMGVTLNIPILMAFFWITIDQAHLPMWAAAPSSTVFMLGWNFIIARLTIGGARSSEAGL